MINNVSFLGGWKLGQRATQVEATMCKDLQPLEQLVGSVLPEHRSYHTCLQVSMRQVACLVATPCRFVAAYFASVRCVWNQCRSMQLPVRMLAAVTLCLQRAARAWSGLTQRPTSAGQSTALRWGRDRGRELGGATVEASLWHELLVVFHSTGTSC